MEMVKRENVNNKFEFRIFGDKKLLTKTKLEKSSDLIEEVKDDFCYDIVELLENLGILEWIEIEVEEDSAHKQKGDKIVGWRLRLWENKEKPFNDVE